MSMVRVIARLDIKGANLVKGIRLEGLRVLGDPDTFARYYYESGADELIYQDAVASLYGRNSLCEMISRTSREIFIPLTVGGGLRSIEDIRQALAAGADKVSLNTAVIADPQLIREASRRFGSSTMGGMNCCIMRRKTTFTFCTIPTHDTAVHPTHLPPPIATLHSTTNMSIVTIDATRSRPLRSPSSCS